MNKLKRLVFHKQKGNMTSFFIGIMFIMVLIILMLIAIRTVMVSESLYFIDDALTGSVLGGATANEMEYGRSNQILLQNADEAGYIKYTSAGKTGDNSARNGWEKIEADILISELNYNSTVFAVYEYLPDKMIKDTSATGVRQIKTTDKEMLENIASMLNILHINLTNSNGDTVDDSRFSGLLDVDKQSLSLYTTDKVTNERVLNALTITNDEMSNSLLNDYIVSDVKVSRLEVYNVYRQTFAERHVYASENMVYKIVNKQTNKSSSGLTYEELRTNRTQTASKKINDPDSKGFIDASTNSILNDSRYDIYVMWQETLPDADAYKEQLRQQRLSNDKLFFGSNIGTSNFNGVDSEGYIKAENVGAICYTDTAVTYQQAYDKNKKEHSGEGINGAYYINNREYYGFMYPMNVIYNNDDNTLTTAETVDEAIVEITDSTYRYGETKLRSAIEGYTVYSYVLDSVTSSGDTQISNPYQGKYIDLSTKTTPVNHLVLGCFNSSDTAPDDRTTDVNANHYKSRVEGGKIYNTTLYLELTFTMSTFREVNSLFSFGDMGTYPVTIGRLVDIDPYYEEE